MSIWCRSLFLVVITSVSPLFGQTIKTANVTFTTIDVPGSYIFNNVSGIDVNSNMVGYYCTIRDGVGCHAYEYSSGNFAYFDYPGADSTFAFGINDSGLIAGAYELDGGLFTSGFVYDGTNYTIFNFAGVPQTFLRDINNSGQMVGLAGVSGAYIFGFRVANGKASELVLPSQYDIVIGYAANNVGNIAVSASDLTITYAYIYRNGHFQQLNFPGASDTAATGINDAGIVVGWYAKPSQLNSYAFNGRTYLQLAYPGAMQTIASKVNKSGRIVGSYTLDNVVWHGFVTSALSDSDFQ